MTRPYAIAFAMLLAGLVTSSSARAEDKEVCATSYEQSQRVEQTGKLLLARNLYRTCTQECTKAFRDQCVDWLSGIERRVPTVVLRARNRAGDDRVDVRVTMDGVLVTSSLDGREIEVDPGNHLFRFEVSGKGPLERRVVVGAGERARTIVVELPDADTGGTSRKPGRLVRAVPWYGYALGAIGVAGLGGFAAFGALGRTSESDLATCSPRCTPDRVDHVRMQYRIADVSLGVGALAIAGAIVVILTRPETLSNSAGTN